MSQRPVSSPRQSESSSTRPTSSRELTSRRRLQSKAGRRRGPSLGDSRAARIPHEPILRWCSERAALAGNELEALELNGRAEAIVGSNTACPGCRELVASKAPLFEYLRQPAIPGAHSAGERTSAGVRTTSCAHRQEGFGGRNTSREGTNRAGLAPFDCRSSAAASVHRRDCPDFGDWKSCGHRATDDREPDPELAVRGADAALPLRRRGHHGRDPRRASAE